MDKRVEIQLGISPDLEGLQQAEQKIRDGLDRMQSTAGDQGSFSMPEGMSVPPSAQQPFSNVPPPPSAPAPAGGSASDVAGSLERLQARLADLQGMAGSAPAIAQYGAGQLKHDAMQAALADPGSAGQYQELVDSLKGLTGSVKEEGKGRSGLAETLNWFRANAFMQMGQAAVADVQQGRFFGAGGGLLGGAMGLIGGPAGMAIGSNIGRGLGGMVDSLIGGTSGVRGYEKNITDIAGQFGDYGNLGALRNYQLGNRYGYKAEETAGMFDRLRSGNVIDSAAEGTPVVMAMQELTRALGLNAEATIDLYTGYVQTGGDRGAEGARSYMAEVVGGAIESGFEGNIQQYAEMMNSSRSQIVMQSATAVGDRAFDRMNDIMASITGGDTATSRLFRDNPQMAQQGLATFMQMGGTTDPYGQAAGFMRLAGIGEGQIDRRFTSADQQQANAMTMTNFISARMQEMSGMSAGEFQSGAQNDPEFVRRQLQQNVALQRQVGDVYLPGILGREATAGDIRTFEQLSNIAIANGGQLPAQGESGAGEVNKLLEQLSATPADAARQAEAERHNKQMEVMSHFQELMTRTDEWMANIYDYILKFDLEAVQDKILSVMDWIEEHAPGIVEGVEKFVTTGIDKITQMAEDVSAMVERIVKWADENNIAERFGAAAEGTRGFALNAARGEGVAGAIAGNVPVVGNIMNYRRDGALSLIPGYSTARALLRRGRGGDADDEFNDTPPGGIVAEEGYNLFRFRPGDRVTAQNGAPPGVTTGTGSPLDQLEIQIGIGFQQLAQEHQEIVENWKQMHELNDKWYEVSIATEANTNKMAEEHWPEYFKQFGEHLKSVLAIQEQLGILDKAFPAMIGQLGAIAGMIEFLGSSGSFGGAGGAAGAGGGAGGTTGGAFASGLFTGPAANIGGSSAYHIDSKISKDVGAERAIELIDQMARAYEEQGRRMEFSNRGVAGESWDVNATIEEKRRMLDRIDRAHSHSPNPQYWDFDYYIPQGGESRHGASAQDAEMMLPVIPGGRADYSSGGRYGNFVSLYDAQGNLVMKTGHGDDRRTLPSDRTFDTAPVAPAGGGSLSSAGGGSIDLSAGYESVEALGNQLSQMDGRFNSSTPEGRAALALAMGIGGSEVYSKGSNQTDFFTRRGGTGNNMLGFAQYNLAYHRATTDTPTEYADFFADMMTGERALPNGRQGRNFAGELSQRVQSGQIQNGQQLIAWMQSGGNSGLGGSNWQGVDDGWTRVPGLADQLVQFVRGGGGTGGLNASAGSGGIVNSGNTIHVNVNGGNGNPAAIREAAQSGAQRALDEFGTAWSAGRQQQSAPAATY